jgi:hypothetical protein
MKSGWGCTCLGTIRCFADDIVEFLPLDHRLTPKLSTQSPTYAIRLFGGGRIAPGGFFPDNVRALPPLRPHHLLLPVQGTSGLQQDGMIDVLETFRVKETTALSEGSTSPTLVTVQIAVGPGTLLVLDRLKKISDDLQKRLF